MDRGRPQTGGTVSRSDRCSRGRAPDNDLVLPDPDKLISKRHCAIERQGGGVVLIDLSANGISLEQKLTPELAATLTIPR